QITPPAGAVGIDRAIISPDGRKLVFGGVLPSGRRLYLRNFDRADPHALAEDPDGFTGIFWSPDSRKVAFFNSHELTSITLDSGAVQVLHQASSLLMNGSWSSTGVILFGEQTGPLLQIPETGG